MDIDLLRLAARGPLVQLFQRAYLVVPSIYVVARTQVCACMPGCKVPDEECATRRLHSQDVGTYFKKIETFLLFIAFSPAQPIRLVFGDAIGADPAPAGFLAEVNRVDG